MLVMSMMVSDMSSVDGVGGVNGISCVDGISSIDLQTCRRFYWRHCYTHLDFKRSYTFM